MKVAFMPVRACVCLEGKVVPFKFTLSREEMGQGAANLIKKTLVFILITRYAEVYSRQG